MLEINKTYLGDCLEEMQKIDNNVIDMILCDLPYGTTTCSWDIIIPFALLWEQYDRIIKDDGAVVLFGQEPFTSLLRLSNLENYKYDWYWQKERPTNIMQLKRRPGKVIETISVFYKKQCFFNPQKTFYGGKLRTNKIKNGSLGKLIDSNEGKPTSYQDDRTRYPIQILNFNRDTLTSNLHPTQKPVDLLEYLIKTYTNEGNLILDNCAGSGSTGVACLNTKRNYIMMEKEKKYFDIINNRITTWQEEQKDSFDILEKGIK